ncbi:MAG: lipocalin family protein [Saprospiraceae bacterium]
MKNLIFLIALFTIGCQNESTYQEQELLGDWNAVSWKDVTNQKTIDAKVSFNFTADNAYIGNYGNSSEKGKYWIAGDNLHTIEDGKAEKKVKIKKLANDTLIFEMNRVGTIEEMVLIRN